MLIHYLNTNQSFGRSWISVNRVCVINDRIWMAGIHEGVHFGSWPILKLSLLKYSEIIDHSLLTKLSRVPCFQTTSDCKRYYRNIPIYLAADNRVYNVIKKMIGSIIFATPHHSGNYNAVIKWATEAGANWNKYDNSIMILVCFLFRTDCVLLSVRTWPLCYL